MRYHNRMKKRETLLKTLLGGLSPEQFLANYWHKKPLLIRGAIPQFKGLLSPDELAGLACEDDVQSRLVSSYQGEWAVQHGPLDEATFAELPERDWTLLVQGVNHWLPEAADLLAAFSFIPHARLDDLMVSYAPDGGGVGPHFDSYDVFLLQGQGQREWRLSEQDDLAIIDHAPLRILKHFHTEQTYVLDPGDMLYLPPKVAHWGIAKGDCMTYSIGFRAPSAQELATQFLGFLQDKIQLAGLYADPHLTRQAHPGELSSAMIAQVAHHLSQIQWDNALVSQFLGAYLTDPKPHLVFSGPKRPLKQARFESALLASGCTLDLASLALFDDDHVYLNGEEYTFPIASKPLFVELADTRAIAAETWQAFLQQAPDPLKSSTVNRVYEWYVNGYLHLKTE